MEKILIGTSNAGKIREIKDLMVKAGFQVVTLPDLNENIDIEETGTTFLENALLKAKTFYDRFHIPTIADDSGLEVEALGMRPGVHSQRYSPSGTDDDNLRLLLKELAGVSHRNARFVCEMVLYRSPDSILNFTGTLEGTITKTIIQKNGFGYDPVFYIPSLGKRLSECSLVEKNAISHRGQAVRLLIDALLTRS